MSREQVEEHVGRIREELDREREERNYFQLERDKIHTFWEITRRQLEEKKAELRNKDREMEEAEERHQVEIKPRYALPGRSFPRRAGPAWGGGAGVSLGTPRGSPRLCHLAQAEHCPGAAGPALMCWPLGSALCRGSWRPPCGQREVLALQLPQPGRAGSVVTETGAAPGSAAGEAAVTPTDGLVGLQKHTEEITKMRNDFERQVREIEAKYDKKMKTLRDELDLRRKTEIHEVEERKNGQINTLMQRHEEAFTDIKNYYNDITLNNLALINSLKEQMEDMRKKEDRLEKEMAEVSLQNKRLADPLQKAREEIGELQRKLGSHERDKQVLVCTKARLKVTEQELKGLQWEHEVLEQRFLKVGGASLPPAAPPLALAVGRLTDNRLRARPVRLRPLLPTQAQASGLHSSSAAFCAGAWGPGAAPPDLSCVRWGRGTTRKIHSCRLRRGALALLHPEAGLGPVGTGSGLRLPPGAEGEAPVLSAGQWPARKPELCWSRAASSASLWLSPWRRFHGTFRGSPAPAPRLLTPAPPPQDVLDSKNSTIKDLQYELARVCKAHNDLLRTYEAKLLAFGIPLDNVGFKPLETAVVGQTLGQGPAGLVGTPT
ncbi:PREDICTED: growth arrest-specific protein 8 [Condylura cristata]|uniref:growth arrest-specific protein 8 n=1 Tax=Condylura cristata TaxID=143302 RepID=UPI0006439493|nr:PREDICTED: growth arrest-specific protein 8 [Condylura cristata]